MTQAPSYGETKYDELVQGRVNGAAGGVELLLAPVDDTDHTSEGEVNNDAIVTESRMIAQRIVELKNSRTRVYGNRADAQARDFEFHDAAILLRDRRYARVIEQVLVACNIPYVLSGGIGFYQMQEVYDVLGYFKFLLNPEDDVALAGVLRSPFFTISDAELYEISMMNRGDTFWDKTKKHAGREQASLHLKRAVTVLRDDLVLAHRLSIPILAHRVFRRTGWQGIMSGVSSGQQRIANIQKLLHMAREFEAKGYTTLYDFVARLTLLVKELDREGQATVDTPGSCVQVMTIHAAKGLEFPIVFVPFTHRPFHYGFPPFLEADIGMAFNVRDSIDLDKEYSPPLYHYLQRRSKRKTDNEEKRIFYVACTRARDLLILSGQKSEKLSTPSYLSWLRDGLGNAFDIRRQGVQILQPLPMHVLRRENDRYSIVQTLHPLTINVRFPQASKTFSVIVKHNDPGAFHPGELFIERLPARTSGEFFSATHIKTFLERPTKYYLKYHLGISEKHARPNRDDEHNESSDELFGDAEGNITHEILRHVQASPVTEKHLRARAALLASSYSGGREYESAGIIDAVVKNVMNFVESDIGKEVLSAKETKTEFTINSVFGQDFLLGTIDRLYTDSSGNWNIVDYKTDRVDAHHVMSRSEIYKPQLSFYALLLSKLYAQNAVRGSLVFLRHPATPMNYVFEKVQINQFETTLRGVISRIKSSDFSRSVSQCETCPFRSGPGCLIPSVPGRN